MVVQEESNNIELLAKPENNTKHEESNTLINAHDERKFPGRGKNHISAGYKKDTRVCTHSNRSGYTIEFVTKT